MTITCLSCGASVPQENRFCGQCGQTITDEQLDEFQVQTLRSSGRRYISAVFTDVVSSTELVRKLDPEQFERIMALYQSICDEVITDFGGEVIEVVGDGIVALFTGHENSTESAVRAGIELVESIAELRPIDAATSGSDKGALKLNIRVGISSGEALVKKQTNQKSQQLLGQPPYLASRLQSLANTGQILVCPETYRKTQAYFEFSKYPKSKLKLKGFDDIEDVWCAAVAKESQFRFNPSKRSHLSPMAGRSKQLESLFAQWELCKQKKGQIALIDGPPGMGKSRLLAEFQRRIKRQTANMITLKYQCSQFAENAPLYPVMQQISRASKIKKSDTAEIITEKLCGLLNLWGVSVELFCPILLPLVLGTQSAARNKSKHQGLSQKEIADAIRACINLPLMFTRRMPVLVVIEDMHWADAASNKLMLESIERATAKRIMIVATYRSNEWDRPDFKQDNLHRYALEPLDGRQANALLESIQIGSALSKAQKETILSKSQGNPLIIEELSHTVVSHAESNGQNPNQPKQNSTSFQTPSALFDLFIHRYDKFEPLVKSVAQLAAVIGQEFDFDLVRRILDLSDQQARDCVHKLIEEEQFFRVEDDSSWYRFRHALIRDAIYDNTLNHDKFRLHQAINAQLMKNKITSSPIALNRIAHHQEQMDHYAAYTS